ncbi:hypothetical protein LCGC14_2666330, partial [marine sediment metagenome]
QDLLCRFHIGDVRDLYAHFVTGVKDSVVVIWADIVDELEFYIQLFEIGNGFIGVPHVAKDVSEKMIGPDSLKITSSYESGGFKEIRFGWKSGFIRTVIPTGSAYFDISGGAWYSLDEPEGWGGWYWDRQ